MSTSSPAGSPTPDASGAAVILGYLSGAGQMMLGRSEGLRRLDLTADGFWTSFLALPVALPPLALSWIEYEGVRRAAPLAEAGPFLVYGAHALADLLAWILPVALLMALAGTLGLERRLAPLVVSTNWGNALLAWALLPLELFLIATNGAPIAEVLTVAASFGALALMVRLVSVALGGDLKAAVGVTLLIVFASFASYGAIADLTGVALI